MVNIYIYFHRYIGGSKFVSVCTFSGFPRIWWKFNQQNRS